MQKIWKIQENKEVSPDIVQAAGGSNLLAKLLLQRGIDTVQKVSDFLFVVLRRGVGVAYRFHYSRLRISVSAYGDVFCRRFCAYRVYAQRQKRG